MAADISSIMQLLQRQAALVPPAYSTVSSPHQPPGPPCPLQPVLPITPIQPLSQVSPARSPDHQVWGSPSPMPHCPVFQPHCGLGALLSLPRFGVAQLPILQPHCRQGSLLSLQTWGRPLLCPITPSSSPSEGWGQS